MPPLSIKDVHATGEAFSPQNRTPSTLKDEIYHVSYFSGPFLLSWIQIGIANPDSGTPLNPDPDPQHCFLGQVALNPDPTFLK
jgi:hypothetical protein